MSSAALPLWADTAHRAPRRSAGKPPLPPRPLPPASWCHDALPTLRAFVVLLLLAPLLSFATFLVELASHHGAVPEQYLRSSPSPLGSGSGAVLRRAVTSSANGGSGGGINGSSMLGPYSPDVIRLLSPIDRDFEAWQREGIDLEAVEQMYCELQRDTFRVQVISGKAYVVGEMKQYMSRQWHLKIQIQEMMERWPGLIPDVDLVLYTDDIPPGYRGNPRPCHKTWGPLFTLNKLYVSNSHWNRAHSFAVMNPCNTMGGFPESNVGSWAEMRARLSTAAANVSWEERVPRLLFRGGKTSPERIMLFENQEVAASPLADIAEATGDNPQVSGRVELHHHCQYKYLLHLQGNTYATRLKWLLACGSVVLFAVDPEYFHQEFWYHMLEDGKNIRFLPPVTPDNNGSHLLEAVAWLEAHPAEAARIAEGARTFVDEILTPDNVLLYWRALFTKYGSLMNFKVELHPDAILLENSIATGRTFAWPDWWECPRFRTCGRVCPLWPDRPIAPHVYHAPPYPFEGSYMAESKCLADMFGGM